MKNIEKFGGEYINSLKMHHECDFRRSKLDYDIDECSKISCNECNVKFGEWLDSEYAPQIDWRKVPLDTPIIVTSEYGVQRNRHLAGYSSGCVLVFPDGRTSHTFPINDILLNVDKNLVKLARPEDLKKYSM